MGSRIPLPDGARDRPVWSVSRLPDGEYAIGLEQSLLVGRPPGAWRTIPLPTGGGARVVAGHGRVLVQGPAGLHWLEQNRLVPVPIDAPNPGVPTEVPEGWLVGSDQRLLLLRPDGRSEVVFESAVGNKVVATTRVGEEVVAFNASSRPRVWRGGRLLEQEFPGTLGSNHLHFHLANLWFTSRGVIGADGTRLLGVDARNRLYHESVLMSGLQSGDRLFFATYRAGFLTYRPDTEIPESRCDDYGNFYSFAGQGTDFLAGTTRGAFVMLDPGKVRLRRTDREIRRLEITPEGVFFIGLGQAETIVGSRVLGTDEPFPPVGAAHYRGRTASFGARNEELTDTGAPNPVIVTTGRSALFVFPRNVTLLDEQGQRSVQFAETLRTAASDGQRYYIATKNGGVRVVNEDGTTGPTFGFGACQVRDVGGGRVLLLYENGDIRDREGDLLATVDDAQPHDATVLQGQLLVLVRRPGRSAVIGELLGPKFRPLEIPGLGAIDAEFLGVYRDRLYVAGREGVLELAPPFDFAREPAVVARWNAPAEGGVVRLADSKRSTVEFVAGDWQPAHAPSTTVRVKVGDGEWRQVAPGATVPLLVEWGRTPVRIETERQMFTREASFTVVRPYPWWMRAWAWPLHVLAVGTLLWVVVRWRTRQLAARTAELERQVAERTASLVRSNAAKEEFLATVGHEIRNPLNGLLGIAHMLQDSDVGGREKNFLRVLAGCAEQLRSMVDDVLDFSRIERGQTTLVAGPFEAVALVEQSARVMDPQLEACALLLPESPTWLLGDSGKIRQIVCNLISNALKYGRPREAGVDLRLTETKPGRTLLRIAVRNTGPTIPAAELPRLFEPFKRGTHTGDAPGFGLGLAVCRRLAAAMNGHLTATSADGTTEFVFEVELAQCHEPARPAVAEVAVSRALGIEDEAYNRLVLGHVLRELGYEVDWAPDGASALQLAARQSYDLIVTDWRLPDVMGDELCRRLQRVLGEPRPPIIAVTAYSGGEKLDAARAAGMAGFITKPVTREKLERLIRGLAGTLRPRRALDVPPPAQPRSALDLRPAPHLLAADIARRWGEADTQAQLRDPRAARTAHALRSLLLLAGETDASEQVGLLEANAAESDWTAVDRLLPLLREDIAAVCQRLAPR